MNIRDILKAKGSNEVAFRIAVKDGKVAMTARGVSGGAAPKSGGTGSKK